VYLEGFGDPPVQIDTAGAIVSAPAADVPSMGTITVVGARPWVPWLIAAGLLLLLVFYLTDQAKQRKGDE
jgi:hypothetical protein